MQKRRVVITGTGVISCVGNNSTDFWQAVINGRCGIGPVTRFDVSEYRTQIAGEVKNFECNCVSPKETKRLDPVCQYGMVAACEALQQAGLPIQLADAVNPDRVGVLVSSGIGGLGSMTDQHAQMLERGPGRVSPLMIPMMIGDLVAGNISMLTGATGPNFGLVSACATGCHSIGEAAWVIQRNDADIMLAGGAEASLVPLGFAGFCSMKAMSQRNDDPLHASRPFDRDRDGFVMSEGAGVLVLEEYEHAKRRGAPIIAEIVGYGASADAYHITSPHPEGRGAAAAITRALEHAGLNPEDVDYINAHGTSTPLNDKYETAAIKLALGDSARKVSVSSVKGTIGHGLGAAGGLESICCIEAIRNSVVPPTINYENPDPECDLDITPNTARERKVDVALNINLGFGGHNGVLAFKRI
ncbi:MAG: beta-ketoacyl-ACP synthase II [Lentisphaeria bacterium]|nr:beta-ketoacyl-ACP synthase II [Lentisphaeria bacterium]